jgi:uncharacterized protein (TIGR04255 family)
LKTLTSSLRERYPFSDVRHRFQTRIQTRIGAKSDTATEDLGFEGIVLKDRDKGESKVLQLKTSGFTLNQIGGYTSAEALLEEAMSLWSQYAAAVAAPEVVRVAMRYINELMLPFQHGDRFERFLRAAPEMPADAPQMVASFLTRLVLPVEGNQQLAAIVTQRLEHNTEGGTPYVLDLDVYHTGQVSVDPAALQPIFERIREVKNQLFFAFLTDTALEPYR